MWIIRQDWSQCTVTCGGGTQTLQRECIPPRDGGRPCDGDAILNRPCNTQTCGSAVIDSVEEGVETLPEILQVNQVSGRYQEFEEGVKKEGDLEWMNLDIDGSGLARFPVRAVLNTNTFTIFREDRYDTILFSVNLSKIKG